MPAVAHEVVVLPVKSAVMRVAVALANGVALVVRTFPRSIFARAFVAVAFDHASFLVVFAGLSARA